jgi:hypothetical protein
MRSAAMNRIGPLPTYSVICLYGSVLAMRSGITTASGVPVLPRAAVSRGNGFLSTQRKVRSSSAASSFSIARIIWPAPSRADQRLRLATASRANTGSPS